MSNKAQQRLPGNAYVIVASCLAATAGLLLKRALRKQEKNREYWGLTRVM